MIGVEVGFGGCDVTVICSVAFNAEPALWDAFAPSDIGSYLCIMGPQVAV